MAAANEDNIMDLLIQKDDVTWKAIIYDLVKTEQMNPWDVDVSVLAKKYMDMVKKLKELDFRISGKVVLAAAILLKLKSNHLLEKDINNFDRMISTEDDVDEFYDSIEQDFFENPEKEFFSNKEVPPIIPKTPQLRKGRVSVYDLVDSLQKALEVKDKRDFRNKMKKESPVKVPKNKVDISFLINSTYKKVKNFFRGKRAKKKLTFTYLTPSHSKRDKVLTLVPLLHLENDERISMDQEEHFSEIEINLVEKKLKREFGSNGL